MKWFSILLLLLILLAALVLLSTGPVAACGGGFACGDGGRNTISSQETPDIPWQNALISPSSELFHT